MFFKKNLSFILLSIAIFIIIFKNLVMIGAFQDGMLYSCLAMNMAHGIGSLWQPSFIPSIWPQFYEHPPLSFWLESWFFYFLGDGWWVDRLYCLVMALLTLLAVALIYRKRESQLSLTFIWIPLLVWTINFANVDVYVNNYIEVTFTVFSTLACWTVIQGMDTAKLRWFSAAVVLIVAAFFTNGLQAFFPILIPIIHWFIFRQQRVSEVCLQFLYLVLMSCALIGLILLYKPAYHNIYEYLSTQLFPSITGQRGGDFTDWKHFYNILFLLLTLSPLILLTAILFFIQSIVSKQSFLKLLVAVCKKPDVRFYALIAAVAFFPTLISSRQGFHYFAQSLPFWSLTFASVLGPLCIQWINKLSIQSRLYKLFLLASTVTMIIAIMVIVMHYKQAFKRTDTFQDINKIQAIVGDHAVISIRLPLNSNWALAADFYRYHKIEISTQQDGHYYLQYKQVSQPPEGYQLINIPLNLFNLFEKK